MSYIRRFFQTITYCAVFFFILNLNVYATEKAPSLEETYHKVGFKSVKEAKSDFKNVHGDPKLPIMISTKFLFNPTHSFGRFSESDNNLELDYINNSTHAFFKINVYPIKNEVPLGRSEKVGTMIDGTKFSYKKGDHFYIFRFKTNKYSYWLSSNYKGENSNISEKDFINIAQTIIKGLK